MIGLFLAIATPTWADGTTTTAGNACATADAYLQAGETEQARKAYDAVIKANPSEACAQAGLAKINAPQPDSMTFSDVLNSISAWAHGSVAGSNR